MPWLSSAALVHYRRAPQAEGLGINLDRHIEPILGACGAWPEHHAGAFFGRAGVADPAREKPTRANACWRRVPEC